MAAWNFTTEVRAALNLAKAIAAGEPATRRWPWESPRPTVTAMHVLRGACQPEVLRDALPSTVSAVDWAALRAAVEPVPAVDPATAVGSTVRYSRSARRALELSMVVARDDAHSWVDLRHLLRGLMRADSTVSTVCQRAHVEITSPGSSSP